MTATLNAYNKLSDKRSIKAKMLLGEMSRGLAVTDIAIQIDKAKQNIIANADKYADYFNKKGINITAEQIRSDKKNIATKFAILEWSGKFALNETDYNRISEQGQREIVNAGLLGSTAQRLGNFPDCECARTG